MVFLAYIGFIDSAKNYFEIFFSFIYTDYWFINTIILFYFIGYPLLIIKNQSSLKICTFFIFLTYIIVYTNFFDLGKYLVVEQLPHKIYFYFITFIFGILFYYINERQEKKKNKYIFLVLFIFLLFSYLLIKLYGKQTALFYELQIVQQILQLFIVFSFVRFSFDFKIYEALKSHKIIISILNFISNITLEIYLIHGLVINIIIGIESINLFSKFCLIFLISIVFSYLLNQTVYFIKNIKNENSLLS